MTASGATEARRPLGSFAASEGNNFEMFFTMADTNLQPTKLRQDAGERFGVVNVAGDGNCLFHALGLHDGEDGGALRLEVADFMEAHALNQDGFEGAWLEEAEALQQGRWGGDTAVTAYSLLRQVRVEIHVQQASGTVLVKDATHQDVADLADIALKRVLYNGADHYQALVPIAANQQGWEPAWEQPSPPIYFQETKPEPSPAPSRPPAKSRNRKPACLTKPGSSRKKVKKELKKKAAEPSLAQPQVQPLVRRRYKTKTMPPPELQDDILTELGRTPVKAKSSHPHRKQEDLIKDRPGL